MTIKKMATTAKNIKRSEQTSLDLKGEVNFMNGTSYTLNPLETLKMVSASSIFGEPQYYRNGEFAESGIQDAIYNPHALTQERSLIDPKFAGKKTSKIMEEIIDEALSFDFLATLAFAKTLRYDFYMRLNPQVIMVRAAIHPDRSSFTNKHPDVFSTLQQEVMKREDEPAIQATYYLYAHNGDKKRLPSLLKRSWKQRYEKMNRFGFAKYKTAGIGAINTIRLCHAKGPLVDELMKTGTLSLDSTRETWERMRSAGASWKEILESVTLGHMALLRNLRNIFVEIEDLSLCKDILAQLKESVISGMQFPFRYYAAFQRISEESAIHHKQLVLDALEECIDISRDALPKRTGKKVISLSDNSGSAWGTFNSKDFGMMTVAEIDNLSAVLTAQNADEGYVGVFGDRLEIVPISKREGALKQAKHLSEIGGTIGQSTENGVWLFFNDAIQNKTVYDEIYIYSDQQAGHGGLYGKNSDEYEKYAVGRHFDVLKMAQTYREQVNPKVNIFSVQTAGYTNVCVPETLYRTHVLYGWTGKETLYADAVDRLWDQMDAKRQ